jgi:oligosaccharide repeat unit polymerase
MILPPVVCHFKWIEGPGSHFVYEYYDSTFTTKYIFIIIMFTIAFYVGSFFGSKLFNTHRTVKIKNYDSNVTAQPKYLYTFILLLVLVYLFIKYPTFNVSHKIFDAEPILGFISTIVMLSFFLLLYDINNKVPIRRRWITILILLLFLFFLLNSGTRMYFLIPCVMILLYCKEKKILNLRKIGIIILLISILILIIGVVRNGNSFDASLLIYIFLAEPCFNWLNVSSFLAHNQDLPMLAYPANFISSFIYFIPKFILPTKGYFIKDTPYYSDAPLGGTNIFVSLISNFGITGSLLFLITMGMLSSFLYSKTNNKFIYVYYIAYCSIIPFQFFRDSFALSNKSVFFNFLLLPILIMTFSKIFNLIILHKSNK